jgi:DNA-binding response OmpR family regulator
MNTPEPIVILEEDEQARQFLEHALSAYGLGVRVVKVAPETAALVLRTPEKPLRLGTLIDRIAAAQRKHQQKNSQSMIEMAAGYALDPVNNLLVARKDGAKIRLTEKEKEILCALAQAPERRMTRESLLRAVWGYGENIETHTLETHIYRLRQKIEANPAAPLLILTHEDGYALPL